MQMKTRGWRFETDRIPPRVWSKVPYNLKELWTLVLVFLSLFLRVVRMECAFFTSFCFSLSSDSFLFIIHSTWFIYLSFPISLVGDALMVCRRGRGINRLLISIVYLTACFWLADCLSLVCSLYFSKSRQYLSVYSLSVCLSFCVCLPVPLFVCPSVCLSVWLSLCLSVSMYLSVSLSLPPHPHSLLFYVSFYPASESVVSSDSFVASRIGFERDRSFSMKYPDVEVYVRWKRESARKWGRRGRGRKNRKERERTGKIEK